MMAFMVMQTNMIVKKNDFLCIKLWKIVHIEEQIGGNGEYTNSTNEYK